ncbi:hypothetical protein ACN28E_54090 [Archangium lansingense]|uniref:hypothetical protein n=1 Tax=Archangium lansingense TaxID=2995310 RepID=UPI003B761DAC
MTSIAKLMLPLLLLCTGCTVTVAQLNPSPNLDLPPTSQSLSLKLEDAVSDSLVVPVGPAYAQMEVNDWRHSLERGFTNAFKNSHSLGNGPTELTLQLLEVHPGLILGSAGGENSKATGQLRYKARLLDANGNIVKRLTGTAIGHKDALGRRDIPLAIQSAVETMYEEIAASFFGASVSGVSPSAAN